MSHVIAVDTVTRSQAGQPRDRGLIPGRVKKLSLLYIFIQAPRPIQMSVRRVLGTLSRRKSGQRVMLTTYPQGHGELVRIPHSKRGPARKK
jgi:hypothetical protein